jgi:hypothetical protein
MRRCLPQKPKRSNIFIGSWLAGTLNRSLSARILRNAGSESFSRHSCGHIIFDNFTARAVVGLDDDAALLLGVRRVERSAVSQLTRHRVRQSLKPLVSSHSYSATCPAHPFRTHGPY